MQNEVAITEKRLMFIKQEKRQYKDMHHEYTRMIEDVNSFRQTLQWKGSKENDEMESLQVRMYNQTII